MGEELKPCPGYGRDGSENNAVQMAAVSLVSFKSAAGGRAFCVECACGFKGPSSIDEGDAIARWNTRSNTQDTGAIHPETLAAVKARLSEIRSEYLKNMIAEDDRAASRLLAMAVAGVEQCISAVEAMEENND